MSENFLFARGRGRKPSRGRGRGIIRGKRGRGLRKACISSSPEHAPSEKSESGSENNTISETSDIDTSSTQNIVKKNYSPKLQFSSNLFQAFVKDGDEKEADLSKTSPRGSSSENRGFPRTEISLPPSMSPAKPNNNPWFRPKSHRRSPPKEDLNNEADFRKRSPSPRSNAKRVELPLPPWQQSEPEPRRKEPKPFPSSKQDRNPNIDKLYDWNKEKSSNTSLLDKPIKANGELSDLLGNKRNRPKRKRQGKANPLEALIPEDPRDKTMLDTLLMDAAVDDDILGADKYKHPSPKNNVWNKWVAAGGPPKPNIGPNLEWVSSPKVDNSAEDDWPEMKSFSIESESEQSLEKELNNAKFHKSRKNTSKSRSNSRSLSNDRYGERFRSSHAKMSYKKHIYSRTSEKKSEGYSVEMKESVQIEESKIDHEADVEKKSDPLVAKSLLDVPSNNDGTQHLKAFDTRILEYLDKRRIEEQLWVINQLSKTDFLEADRCRIAKPYIENGHPQIDELFYMFKTTKDFSSFIGGLNNVEFEPNTSDPENAKPQNIPKDMPKYSLSGRRLCTNYLLGNCKAACEKYHPSKAELDEIKRLNEVHFQIGQMEWMNTQDSLYPPRFQVCRHTRDTTIGPCRRGATCYFCHWDFENPEVMALREQAEVELEEEEIDVVPDPKPNLMYIPAAPNPVFQKPTNNIMQMFSPPFVSPLPPLNFSPPNGIPPMNARFAPDKIPKIVEIFHKPLNSWLYARVLGTTPQNGLRIQVIPPDPTHKTKPVVAPISQCYPLGTHLPQNLPPGLLEIATKTAAEYATSV